MRLRLVTRRESLGSTYKFILRTDHQEWMRRPLPARSIIVENYFVFANDIGGKYFSIEALKVQPLIHSLAVRGRESYWTEIRLILLDDGTNGPWDKNSRNRNKGNYC